MCVLYSVVASVGPKWSEVTFRVWFTTGWPNLAAGCFCCTTGLPHTSTLYKNLLLDDICSRVGVERLAVASLSGLQ